MREEVEDNRKSACHVRFFRFLVNTDVKRHKCVTYVSENVFQVSLIYSAFKQNVKPGFFSRSAFL